MNYINNICNKLNYHFKVKFDFRYYLIHFLIGSGFFILLLMNSTYELKTVIYLVVSLLLYPFSLYISNCLKNVITYGYEISNYENDMIVSLLKTFYNILMYILSYIFCIIIIIFVLPIILFISSKITLN